MLFFIMFVSCDKYDTSPPAGLTRYNSAEGTLQDIEGNVYRWVGIGSQIWMAENLRTTHYSNGKLIPLVESNEDWLNATSNGYCWPNNDKITYYNYGVIYNYYTIEKDSLCPEGWRLPSSDDWEEFLDFINADNPELDRGEVSTVLLAYDWSESYNGVDSYRFSAYPNGGRSYINASFLVGNSTSWPAIDMFAGWGFSINEDGGGLSAGTSNLYNMKVIGYPVRCIKK